MEEIKNAIRLYQGIKQGAKRGQAVNRHARVWDRRKKSIHRQTKR